MNEENYSCENCKNTVDKNAEHCDECGLIFNEKLLCINHMDKTAKGVCVICSKPFCKECGLWINRGYLHEIFLCDEHSHYEIIEGMIRVYGTFDDVQAQYICDCLEKEELHPFLFMRKASPIHLGGTNYTLYRPSGDFNGHIINENKIMIPCKELLIAERIIKEIITD